MIDSEEAIVFIEHCEVTGEAGNFVVPKEEESKHDELEALGFVLDHIRLSLIVLPFGPLYSRAKVRIGCSL